MTTHTEDPRAGVVRPGGRGRGDLPRPDPDGHHQLRRRVRAGGAQGRRARRRAARRGRASSPSSTRASQGRTNVVARWGSGDGDPLLLHGHLDVVPAEADDWTVHPFSGEIQDGYLWGRGAVDMKDFDAMLLSVVRARARAGAEPQRPMVLCFTADEEAGGHQGAEQIVAEAPGPARGLHRGRSARSAGSAPPCAAGGSTSIEAAEKGMAWMRLTAKGNAGHGSMRHPDNAVTALSAAVARIGAHQWPVRLTPSMQVLLVLDRRARRRRGHPGERRGARRGVRPGRPDARRGHQAHDQPDDAERRLQGQRGAGRGHRARRRPVPARLRGRVLRHPRASWWGTGSRIDYVSKQSGLETTFDGDLVDAMTASLLAEDPDALVAPYLMSGGTDAKHWDKLGIRCFGFAPLRLPGDLDFTALFHGVDERVPTDALEFGARVFDRLPRPGLSGALSPARDRSPARWADRPARRRPVRRPPGRTRGRRPGRRWSPSRDRGTRPCRGTRRPASRRPARTRPGAGPAAPCSTRQVTAGALRQTESGHVGLQSLQHRRLEVGQRRDVPRGPRRGAGRRGQRPGAHHQQRAAQPAPRSRAAQRTACAEAGEPSCPTSRPPDASTVVATSSMANAPRGVVRRSTSSAGG